MQEWIIAMLVVSILLILRDMAKTVFSGKTKEKEEKSKPANFLQYEIERNKHK